MLLCPILLLEESRLAAALSVFLYAASFVHYFYMCFLGFCTLPYLEKPETFLVYPAATVFVLTLIGLGMGVNPTRAVITYYFGYV